MRDLVRRRSLAACLALLVVGVLAGGCDWTQFADGYGHTGDSSGEVTITPANVPTLSLRSMTSPLSQNDEDYVSGEVAVVNDVMYVSGDDDELYAYDASGSDNCAGSPPTCSPLWTASLGGLYGAPSTPTVSNGVVYVMSGAGDQSTETIYAFDASGKTDCSGTPTVCSPLWTATVDTGISEDLTVDNGLLYATSDGAMVVFDANGVDNCSGTPKICSPVWSTTDVDAGGTPSISSGNIAFVAGGTTGNAVYAFDASGKTDCSGGICSPLRTYNTKYLASIPVISGAELYVDTWTYTANGLSAIGGLEVFDATGSTNCSGSPVVCTPLWQSSNQYPSRQPPTVANGDVYVPAFSTIAAFSTSSSTNCSGAPTTVCAPLWTTSATGEWGALSVGGSVLYGAVSGHYVDAFDANGVNGCANDVCSPLWSATSLPDGALPGSGISVANGDAYISAFTSTQVGDEIIQHGTVDTMGLPSDS
jgi:hypothetical protein